ncbi:GNAT family N-acetyltransferase [Streptomyces sp. TRM 70351]|uniref:GNAT family N-acetyltransferase n=1 Tax=Streptomyces sp. TRM 70351 TaxID=3116552 RepID=UPI002E7B9E35|nr:GNAT family N-acetyltransferase [Streptomyces sp. TRM 70351]MEE1928066.1 GNAT family N-acetyltransferase [Streptomyces sp. TRM 70351]
MDPVTLTTGRLLLRALEPRDADAVLAACQDPEIPRWTSVPDPYEREHAEDFVHNVSPAGWRDNTLYNFGVFTLAGDLAGSVGLVQLDRLHTAERQAELGYWTAREHRGHGYTVEAARAVVDWAFTALGVERLEWCAHVGNEASRAVAVRLGFVMEGVQRARILHRGTRQDAWTAALLPSDWGRRSLTPYLPSA